MQYWEMTLKKHYSHHIVIKIKFATCPPGHYSNLLGFLICITVIFLNIKTFLGNHLHVHVVSWHSYMMWLQGNMYTC